MAILTFPKPRACPWRVVWQDWRDHHDWVGRRSLRPGARRVAPPPRKVRHFWSRDAAQQFVRLLRSQVPEGELAVMIIGQPEPKSARPANQMLPGDWPQQRRAD
jgi:hypothetical protein